MDEAICKFCKRKFLPLVISDQAKMPLHRVPGYVFRCEGGGEPLDKAALNPDVFVPTEPAATVKEMTRGIKLDPKLANSALPNFYEKDGDDDIGLKG